MAQDRFGGIIQNDGTLDRFGGVVQIPARSTEQMPKEAGVDFPLGLPDKNWIGPALRTPIEELKGGAQYQALTESLERGDRRGFWASLTDVGAGDIPFAGDFVDVGRIARVANTARKLKKGDFVDDQELLDLNWYMKNRDRMEQATLLGKAGNVVKEAVTFGVELLSIIGAAKKVAAKGGVLAAREAIEKGVESYAKKFVGNKAASMASRAAAVGFDLNLRAAVYDALRPGATLKGQQERILSQILNGEDEDRLNAFVNSLFDVHFEHVSEFSGEMLGRGTSKLFKKLAPDAAQKLTNRVAKNALLSGMASRFGDPRVNRAKDLLRSVGYDGVVNEMLEERFGGFLRGLFGVDTEAGLVSAVREAIPTPEELGVEAIAFSVPMLGMSGLNSFMGGVNPQDAARNLQIVGADTKIEDRVLTGVEADERFSEIYNRFKAEESPWYSGIKYARSLENVFGTERKGSLHDLLGRSISNQLETNIRRAEEGVVQEEGEPDAEFQTRQQEAGRAASTDFLKDALGFSVVNTEAERTQAIDSLRRGDTETTITAPGYVSDPQSRSSLLEDVTSLSQEDAKKLDDAGAVVEKDTDLNDFDLSEISERVTADMLRNSRDADGNISIQAVEDVKRMFDVKTDLEARRVFETLERVTGASAFDPGAGNLSAFLTPKLLYKGKSEGLLNDVGFALPGKSKPIDRETGDHLLILDSLSNSDGDFFVSPYAGPADIAEGAIAASIKKNTGTAALSGATQDWDKKIDASLKEQIEASSGETKEQLQLLSDMGGSTLGRLNRMVKMYSFHQLGWRRESDALNKAMQNVAPPSAEEARELDEWMQTRAGTGILNAARPGPLDVVEEVEDVTPEPGVAPTAEAAPVAPAEPAPVETAEVEEAEEEKAPVPEPEEAHEPRKAKPAAKPRVEVAPVKITKPLTPRQRETKVADIREAEVKARERVRAAEREEKLELEIESQKEATKRAIVDQRVDIKENQRRLVAYVNDNLAPPDRGRMLSRVTKIAEFAKPETREKFLEKASAIVDEIAVKQETNRLRKKVINRITNERKRLAKAQRKGIKRDVEQNRKIAELLDSVSVLSEVKARELGKTLDHYENNPTEEMPAKLLAQVQTLLKPNVNQMNARQLNEFLADLDSLNKTGRLKSELKAEQAKRALERKADIVEEQQGAVAGKVKDTPFARAVQASAKKSRIQQFSRMAKAYGFGNLRPERIINWLDGFREDGILTKEIFDPILEAETNKLRGTKNTFDQFRKIHRAVDIPKATTNPVTVVDYNGEKIELTLDQMMFIYANSKNDGNRAHLNGTGISDEMIADITSRLPAPARRAVDGMLEFYEKNYERVREVFAREHNVDLQQEKGYFPIKNLELPFSSDAILADALARYEARHASLQKGHTKKRVHSKAAFRKLSYFDTVARSLQETEHYIAYNDAVRDINRFLGNRRIKEALENRSPEAMKEIRTWVKDVARGKIRRTDTWLDRISEWLRTNYATSVLGFNLVSALKQPASIAQGLRRIDPQFAAQAAKDVMQNPKEIIAQVRDKSVMMANRENSFQREIAEIMEKGSTGRILGTQEMLDKFKDASFGMIRYMDKMTTVTLWHAKYMEQADAGKSEREAAKSADTLIRTTQPIGDLINLPGLFRAGGVERAYTLFKNQLNQNINLLFEAGANYKGKKAAAMDVAMFLIVPSFILHLASTGGQAPWEDPREWARGMTSQVTGGLPYFNVLIDAMMRRMTGAKRAPNFLFSMTPPNLKFIEDLAIAINEGNPERMVSATAKLTGVPYTQLRRTYRGLEGFKETGDPRRLIWSEYALKR